MSKQTEIIPAPATLAAQLKDIPSPKLKAMLADQLRLTAEHLLRLAWIVRVLEERGEDLSGRELEVLRLLVEGASNKAIASQLNLSENTIKSHISHLFGKLGVQSRAEAVAVALQRGLVPMRGEPR